MMSIEETLTLHRTTREKYMHAAYMAQWDAQYIAGLRGDPSPWWRGDRIQKMLQARGGFRLNPRSAQVCFLRHARAANRKLVQVKRLQRMLDSPNNWDGWI
jgi:hypothetical protein